MFLEDSRGILGKVSKKPALPRFNTKVPFLFCSWGIGYTKRKSSAYILISTPKTDERSRRLLLVDLVR